MDLRSCNQALDLPYHLVSFMKHTFHGQEEDNHIFEFENDTVQWTEIVLDEYQDLQNITLEKTYRKTMGKAIAKIFKKSAAVSFWRVLSSNNFEFLGSFQANLLNWNLSQISNHFTELMLYIDKFMDGEMERIPPANRFVGWRPSIHLALS